MPYKFIEKPISLGRYEPEGIYLELPFAQIADIVQTWGSNPDFYARYRYNGVSLKGYIGLGFDIAPNVPILAVDQGHISEINIEPSGFDRYIKIEHWWGESLYARLHGVQVESGQFVKRSTPIAVAGATSGELSRRFHLGIRIRPFNRHDGWGGFSDPLPYLNPESIRYVFSSTSDSHAFPPLPLATESNQMHRA